MNNNQKLSLIYMQNNPYQNLDNFWKTALAKFGQLCDEPSMFTFIQIDKGGYQVTRIMHEALEG